ncbi:hypothetical protein XENTR_v10017242 [Xenopus tropicalis]|uniref:Uncharacterized protein LOC100493666 n=1 Tax=Xenopus tropicalis TaxID=8364 RepID=A0A8J0QUD2_XENTR|nr:uncharacterized protein LOC100493666 [Xenopus tropicalis]XP_004915114.2 uncharacterized protein LOC100493666 [Xenopus tropicalis]XP_004915115.2 uncharacterized protein LOC100493666 [Xenopus tropicalis]KAE8599585.1 hypothetical protein XENTR_v10017242 [Xenopus tropicalis]
MSKRGSDTTLRCTFPTTIGQLLKCYSPQKPAQSRKASCNNHDTGKNRIQSSPMTPHCPSVSRHSEQRLRPRTCTACRACLSLGQRTSIPSAATSSSLLPLDRLSHLPYCSSKAKKGRHTEKRNDRAIAKSPDSGKLISCSLHRDFHIQDFTGKCNASLCPRRPGSLDSQIQILPSLPVKRGKDLPVRTQSDICLPQSSHFSDTELRKWIVHFGGDEQAAFMARGLQRLHLAYEEGKAEIGRQAKHKG